MDSQQELRWMPVGPRLWPYWLIVKSSPWVRHCLQDGFCLLQYYACIWVYVYRDIQTCMHVYLWIHICMSTDVNTYKSIGNCLLQYWHQYACVCVCGRTEKYIHAYVLRYLHMHSCILPRNAYMHAWVYTFHSSTLTSPAVLSTMLWPARWQLWPPPWCCALRSWSSAACRPTLRWERWAGLPWMQGGEPGGTETTEPYRETLNRLVVKSVN